MSRRTILFLLFAGLVLWVGGFVVFVSLAPSEEAEISETDAIVVLTGGSERLETALELLNRGAAPRLFVSGVYRGVQVRQLIRMARKDPERLDCCIALGYEAEDTAGNAVESAGWMAENDVDSARLVTAWYHMPRSLLALGRAAPTVTILAHPVFPGNVKRQQWWLWPGTVWLLIREYHKYLGELLTGTFRSQQLTERPA